ncbi:hypothetical protein HanRHA438_Chr05g0239701 [Helianthus annuus]|uniref:uncharacterized protein LOC110941438 n=1 Tax=Helianthus annuus TaxID=4232 RepID=UPI000B8FAE4B|nr:uncharacterized protein LOC110941438 [Helianthus annuus]XP_035846246.1 uncharacterized protein LOC110941438 [Helianthus annuus]XP_035846248.1 uncharacterized protein LOC110941438 [Helianthus annuus]XP_035846249.1 uncharacterized protein LOC110941438 [Helianthus annuus]KAJ0920295.1 hypothetical protein HanRHA438_Chr05g0239701 [Helianthus annuus]
MRIIIFGFRPGTKQRRMEGLENGALCDMWTTRKPASKMRRGAKTGGLGVACFSNSPEKNRRTNGQTKSKEPPKAESRNRNPDDERRKILPMRTGHKLRIRWTFLEWR